MASQETYDLIEEEGRLAMQSHVFSVSRKTAASVGRRQFLQRAGSSALATGAALCLPPTSASRAANADASKPESIVKLLHESFSPRQRETVCFGWEHQDPKRGLLRTRISNNWMITPPALNSEFFSDEQRAMVRAIVEGVIQPDWHERIYQQQQDDSGGFGLRNSIALFGQPDAGKFEFVITGRHLTLRCDGNSSEHVAFGGPIFYGHAAGGMREKSDHPGNIFWPQAVEANKLYQALDGKQQQLALVKQGLPHESKVGFQGTEGSFQGIPISELSADQKGRVQEVLRKLVEPYRQIDRDEVVACLQSQGGLDACHLAFYREHDIGDDGLWDNWRLEGPSFVWHYRGSPHVHVWVNVADDASVRLNA